MDGRKVPAGPKGVFVHRAEIGFCWPLTIIDDKISQGSMAQVGAAGHAAHA
ncbi:hypothetical protein Z946_1112 [Sulfitobacter noctilucicola]|nr:hypothetical protein Z946_1112 [Sulfitobacter noctilucicola]